MIGLLLAHPVAAPSSHTVTVAGYAAVLVAAVLLELAAHRRWVAVPPLEDVVARALRTRPARMAVIAAWAWIGLHFLAR